ncbi:DNA cytosine methyltransferase [Paenibacillus lactis]|uniref:DNA (cytosine-5-)-methyltransferase n=1 Tax=Paenibacillus lactis TaxID=228574 RepID=A0ABS4F9S5_9BACL|nr:DNA cytosine methyltransferase [Paenibacillus lactis]MBP1893009.1 DNA (cytosine-5)-methyltransferase 1 [Paenibacillus lactis]HAF97522.1 DNA (cytosine-5-)-methyltransferase [Paenibacillus lactis]
MTVIREIIVDNFAGGGGASTGIEMATGRSVDIAINHDPAAIAMHRANHPETEHYCESVWDVDPREVTGGRPVGLVWLSPDCKHFSKAKGGKPVEKGIRGLAWVAVRWAATVRPRVIMLENVEEFKTWGPLMKDGYPDPDQKGRTFNCFVNALRRQGYRVEWRELRACDFGAPTIRKRLFLVARCDGRPIVWPEPTHGAPDNPEVLAGKRKPWRTAAEIIDWSIPCPSIFERKKQLAENTERRIARGLQRFILENPNPFIAPFVIKVNHHGTDFRGQPIDEPLQTVTAKNGWGIVTPYIARIGQTGFGEDRLQYKAEDPLTTVTTKAEHLLVSPTLIEIGYGEGPGQAPRVPGLHKPLGTVVSGGRKHALVAAFLARHFGNSVGSSIDDPVGTVTAGGGGHSALVTAHITKFRTGATGHKMDESLHTITSGAGAARPAGAAHTLGLVTSHLVKLRGTCQDGQPTTEPMPTITAGGMHVGEVRAFLLKYYGSADNGQQLGEPLHTVTTKDRFGLVTIHGVDYQIVDIGMRMLEPHELFAAQGFPPNYIIDVDADGRKYSKSAQVARCGNAVPPPFAEALVRANLPELCTGSGNALTIERYKEAVGAGQMEFSL